MTGTLILAHAGEGATWQALLTLLALGLAVVFVLAAVGVVRLDEPGDLILPLAGAAVLASLSGATSQVLSDWVGWAFPLGVVVLVALVLAASTPLQLGLVSPLTWGAVALAVVGIVTLHAPIVRAWHPPPVTMTAAELDDLTVEVVEPADGSTVDVGPVEVVVEATGGSLGDGFVDQGMPADPEELVGLTLTLVSSTSGQSTTVTGDPAEDCASGCDRATYTVEVPEPGEWTIFVEALTADRRPFTRASGSTGSTTARVVVQAE